MAPYRFSFQAGDLLVLCTLALFSLAACGAASVSTKAGDAGPPGASAASENRAFGAAPAALPAAITACWLPLAQRLQNDPAAPPDILRYFPALPEYSPAPMGAKIRELFISAFMRKPKTGTPGPKQPAPRIYRSIVTLATMEKCREFLSVNQSWFDAVEKKHPVPREILVSLLFVETRLGTFLGNENAFWSLACMAAADTPELVNTGLGDIPITAQHNAWLQSKLSEKSAWAYKELRALLAYCSAYNLDPAGIPGSVYGAIGYCQFMPSNLTLYGEDGNGDGVIDLFSEADAIFSAANYLNKHGWKAGASVEAQRAVLKRYNNLTIYANTILALAESLRTGVLQTGPPDAPAIRTAALKKAAAAPQAKAAAAAQKKGAKSPQAKKTPAGSASKPRGEALP